jgi:uncharacterized membrane protein YcaP (DUF421 family)
MVGDRHERVPTPVLFDAWEQLPPVALSAVLTYLGVVALLRVSGKRTLAKLNAFDLVVTVAVGSTLASTALNPSISVAEGLVALGTLVGAQYVVAWTSGRSAGVRRLAKSSPTLLVDRGRLLDARLSEQRVTAGEVHQAIRSSGAGDIGDVAAVVLETDGSLSVIGTDRIGDGSALEDLPVASWTAGTGPSPGRTGSSP